MTNKQDSATESVMNVNSIVKVNHTVKCEITLLLNDKQDRIQQLNLSWMLDSIAICGITNSHMWNHKPKREMMVSKSVFV